MYNARDAYPRYWSSIRPKRVRKIMKDFNTVAAVAEIRNFNAHHKNYCDIIVPKPRRHLLIVIGIILLLL
jgi:hypothetical protein